MKKIHLLIVVLFISSGTFAQKSRATNGEYTQPNKEKMESLRIAHITKKLELTQSEAQAFWPIYNAHEKYRKTFRDSDTKKLSREDIMNLTDADAKSHLKKLVALEEQKLKQELQYIKELEKVLPPKKILLLKNADRTFRRRVLEQLRHRRQGLRNERFEKNRAKREELVQKREEKRKEIKEKRDALINERKEIENRRAELRDKK